MVMSMNRIKKQLSPRETKKQTKEILTAPVTPEPLDNDPSAWKILSKFPKKVIKEEEASLSSLSTHMTSQKNKNHSKHSKRATPGDVLTESPYPHHHPQMAHNSPANPNNTKISQRVFNKKQAKSKV